ncbi:hypothetical protein CJU90_0872 [Yarrowia sp. C11]|nr:hypothetical protein CKK34_2284 [Yarrowia sp. E02]KAG5373194.1 hypothetical protein CJU90_0872 [Yarrowia sp. C11]
MNSDEALKASLATILYIRGVFDNSSYSVCITSDGAPYMRFVSGHDGVALVCDWIVNSEALEEYTLTADQLQSIGAHPGVYFKSLATELETYNDLTTELDSDNQLVVSISLEFVAGYPPDLQRSFRGIFRTRSEAY